jgi:hypothetical protein
MPRSLVLAAPLLGFLVLGIAPSRLHAQTQPSAFMYVGADSNVITKGFGTATLTNTGVSATGLYSFINANSSTTNYKGLSAFSNSQLTISGGTFQQLLAEDTSTINLIGSNLTESSNFYFSPSGDSFYTVSGTLQGSQSPFTASFYRPSTGTLEFNGVAAVRGAPAENPVPEASTTISLGLLLVLGLGYLGITRRKTAHI